MKKISYQTYRLISEGGSGLSERWDSNELRASIQCWLCGSSNLRQVDSTGGQRALAYGHCSGGICRQCGWWNVLGRYSEDDSLYWLNLHYLAEIQSFHIDGLDCAAQSLAHLLGSIYESSQNLSSRFFEELVGAIFRDHLDCKVEMTKRTRDGGKDIVCFDANGGQFYVEVKHYDARRAVGVDIVQRFVGVLYQDATPRGILVTSSRFSRDAKRAAAESNERNCLLQLELRDHHDVLAWLGAFKNQADDEILDRMRDIMPAHYGALTFQ